MDPAIIDVRARFGLALKKMVETIHNLVHEVNRLTHSAMEGKLDIRGNQDAFKGAYQDIIQ